ncbi:MAG: DEAD/DEAH box helicase, partial [Pseudomonadota bacterium]
MSDVKLKPARLPKAFSDWFAGRGWKARPHQTAMLAAARAGLSTLLIAPTGGGKTLAGFLPSLVALSKRAAPKPGAPRPGLHTLYISPLKALAVDVARNVEAPVAEMGLDIRVETRTGDTPPAKRRRQKDNPPDILFTTPEQLALLLADAGAARFFKNLDCVILDEIHSLVASKRGDLLALGLARLRRLAPDARMTGLSATVHDPERLRRFLVP